MKIVHIETLISRGVFSQSGEWKTIRGQLLNAIERVEWPPETGSFTNYAQSGKRRGEGSGVKPIKDGLMASLAGAGWALEQPLNLATRTRPGKIDAVLRTESGPIAVELETGNVSSSHRALNTMALGLLHGVLAAGLLIVPSRSLYRYPTDRIGNWSGLAPYTDLWKAIPCESGILEIIVIG